MPGDVTYITNMSSLIGWYLSWLNIKCWRYCWKSATCDVHVTTLNVFWYHHGPLLEIYKNSFEWISNCIHIKILNVITRPSNNFNGDSTKVPVNLLLGEPNMSYYTMPSWDFILPFWAPITNQRLQLNMQFYIANIDGLVQDCSIAIANALEVL